MPPQDTFEPSVTETGIEMVAVRHLRRHEQVDLDRAAALLDELMAQGVWSVPLLVERHSHVILDGHHRFWCAYQLDLVVVPAHRIEYCDIDLTLETWRPDYPVTIEDVLTAASTGTLLPHKTSRHRLARSLPRCAVAFPELRKTSHSEAA